MRVASLETLFSDAGWPSSILLEPTTDDGLVGRAEITDSRGSACGLPGSSRISPRLVCRHPGPT